jgi:hypothetical protein
MLPQETAHKKILKRVNAVTVVAGFSLTVPAYPLRSRGTDLTSGRRQWDMLVGRHDWQRTAVQLTAQWLGSRRRTC